MRTYTLRSPSVVQAWDFQEFVEFGQGACGSNQHNGVPWSFDFHGHPVTHERDDLYIIGATTFFAKGAMLVLEAGNRVAVYDDEAFCAKYAGV